jgi:hypothetical protein
MLLIQVTNVRVNAIANVVEIANVISCIRIYVYVRLAAPKAATTGSVVL